MIGKPYWLIPLLVPALLTAEVQDQHYSPYVEYSLDLEERGMLKSAAYMLEKALDLVPSRDSESKQVLLEHLGDLRADIKKPAQQQSQHVPLPYLVFGGAQLGTGSNGFAFGLNGRVGRLWPDGKDIALNMGINTPGGLLLGGIVQKRIPLGQEWMGRRKTFNVGGQLGLNTSSGFTAGLVYGLSSPVSRANPNMTIDLMFDTAVVPTFNLTLSVGFTSYFSAPVFSTGAKAQQKNREGELEQQRKKF